MNRKVRGGRDFISLVGTLLLALAGCATTRSSAAIATLSSAAYPVAEPTPPRSLQWTFPVATQAGASVETPLDFHVNLLDRPIRIWFFEEDGKVALVRVVGHGATLPCKLASRALADAVVDPAVDGYITYGAAELRPRDRGALGISRFQDVASDLREELERYTKYVDDIEVHVASGDPDARFAATQTIPGDARVTYAFAGSIPSSDGPVFLPARSWLKGAVAPVHFVVTREELGLDALLFPGMLSSALSSPAYQKLVRESAVDAMLRGWPISTGSVWDDMVIEYHVATKVPAVWRRVHAELERSGVVMSTDSVGGDLVGPSVFYRVKEQWDGSFLVTPLYVVHGAYLERWSPTRNSVVIVRTHE